MRSARVLSDEVLVCVFYFFIMLSETTDAELTAGQTISYSPSLTFFPRLLATIVEVHGSMAELNTGQHLPLSDLQLVPTDERWLPVHEFADRYLVSSHGKVVSLSYGRTGRHRLMKICNPARYPSVNLHRNGFVRQTGVNQLVARHFLPPPPEARLRHLLPKDGNHLNVRADNLQWADRAEMDDLQVLQRFHPCGVRNTHSKLTPALVREIRLLAGQGHTNQQLATRYGVSRPAISMLVRGITWRTV